MDDVINKPSSANYSFKTDKLALGGAFEGAKRTSRETSSWDAESAPPDQVIDNVKEMADARTHDVLFNDGYLTGALSIHKDTIVGDEYRLSAKPNWKMLGVSEEWAKEFQTIVEARFNTISNSGENWLDASGHNTLTKTIRLAIGSTLMTGEVLGVAEWMKGGGRPFSTAMQLVSPDRLSNPRGVSNDQNLKRGVVLNKHGAPTSYWISKWHPGDTQHNGYQTWKRINKSKPWGRGQVLHLFEQVQPAQSRGIAEMVAVLKQMKMTKSLQDVTLQSAVVAASYAATIESELPPAEVYTALGADSTNPTDGINQYLANYMDMNATYLEHAKNVHIDGAKIPAIVPGTKLNIQSLGTPGSVGSSYEQSLLRHIAAALNLSYEQFSRDYTQTNYSSARASMNESYRGMMTKKKHVADATANFIYKLWLEEDIMRGNIPLPPGKDASWFYEPLVKEAICSASWVGGSRGQIDEVKETNAAIARIGSQLSTRKIECARLGNDWQDVLEQQARESEMMRDLDLVPAEIQDDVIPTDKDDKDD